jgi:hypothetical protein
MTPKQPFPPESETQPDVRASGAAPKIKRDRSAASTVPPPPKPKKSTGSETKTSGIRSRKPPAKSDPAGASGATVDEVTADLSRDPRRERDDD